MRRCRPHPHCDTWSLWPWCAFCFFHQDLRVQRRHRAIPRQIPDIPRFPFPRTFPRIRKHRSRNLFQPHQRESKHPPDPPRSKAGCHTRSSCTFPKIQLHVQPGRMVVHVSHPVHSSSHVLFSANRSVNTLADMPHPHRSGRRVAANPVPPRPTRIGYTPPRYVQNDALLFPERKNPRTGRTTQRSGRRAATPDEHASWRSSRCGASSPGLLPGHH